MVQGSPTIPLVSCIDYNLYTELNMILGLHAWIDINLPQIG